ncbi:alpha/beta fold hydrolase (plasmid) [Bartonella sp. HY329]|uniref:S9 family peptidase n=1 Tax=unclassified Bartonella TaxID=2645622 RepID=UPI0021CA9DCF|nr:MULTISPECIES: alpha/beta fold hydrolase [unclassified Bartonella]UXM96603.1 alpha/beta fold hydrolase [Bartonella sp. HY329]UXN10926.1 alpha/beta fold hydrolase [Bartonella sp. HY328]
MPVTPFDNNFKDMADYIAIFSQLNPILSDDKRFLAWRSNFSGSYQIWLLDRQTNKKIQITDHCGNIYKISFRPLSHDLIFLTDNGGDERLQIWLYDAGSNSSRALTSDPLTRHDWGCWSKDGKSIAYSANLNDKFSMAIYVMSVDDGQARCVYEGDGYRTAMSFIEKDNAILILDSNRSSFDQDIFRLDLLSGEYQNYLPHSGKARYKNIKSTANGDILLITDQSHDFFHIAKKSSGKIDLQQVFLLENKDIDLFALSSNQKDLAISYIDDGWCRFIIYDIIGETTRMVNLPFAGVIQSIDWLEDGQKLLLCIEAPNVAPSIWIYDLNSEIFEEQAPLKNNILPPSRQPMVASIKSFDGLEVPYFIYMPDQKPPLAGFPAIIFVHGGPESQWQPNFRADIQYYLAQGIAIIAPNVRGSTGYGRAYSELDDQKLRLNSVLDLINIRLDVASKDDIDESRIGICGQSYGGFMVLAAMTRYPDLWKAGVDFYGIANFHTLLETTGPWRRRLREAEYGDIESMGKQLKEFSPIHMIGAINAPLFLAHGLEDPRVTPCESEMVYSCLRGLGKEVEYLRIPKEGHGFLKQHNRINVFTAVANFWQRHL